MPVSGGLWWSGREWYTRLHESGPVVTHPFMFLLRFLSSLFCPKFLAVRCYVTGWAISFAIGLAHPPLSWGSLLPSFIVLSTWYIFFFLPAVYCWKLVWSEPVNHEASNKKVMKSRGSNVTALVAFLDEGRCGSLPPLEVKLLPTAPAGGEWDLRVQVNK